MLTTLYILSSVTFVMVFIPLLEAEHWLVRGQEYIKVLYLIAAVVLLTLLFTLSNNFTVLTYIFMGINVCSICYCLQKFIPITSLFPTQLPTAKHADPSRQIKLVVFNVWQKNKQYQQVADFLKNENADIVFLLETNLSWYNGLKNVIHQYPHIIKSITNDTYGLILMSKLDVQDQQVKHLVTDKIPSMEMRFIKNGKEIMVYGLHPKPPIIGESLYSSKKDKEFQKIAHKIRENDKLLGHLAVGDFNEVSWGRTFKRFWKSANLNDPRRGRFFKPTFPSYLPIRIPLDHVLCTNDFEFVNFEVKDNMGSDHFPIVVTLQQR